MFVFVIKYFPNVFKYLQLLQILLLQYYSLYNQVLRIIKIAVKSDVKDGRI